MKITREDIQDKIKFIDEQIKVYKKVLKEERENKIIAEYEKEKKIYNMLLGYMK